MDLFVESAAAAALAGYLVAFFKLGAPASPPWALVMVALCAGILSAVLIFFGEGGTLTAQTGAQVVMQGIGAAAIAAGLTRTDEAGEDKRFEAREEKEGR